MALEIKQRIAQIRCGEVPQEYLCTPAGILPEDWSYAKLKDISEIITETVGERSIETVSISAGIGFVNQAEKFGKELSGNQYVKYTVLHKGDFAYNKGNSNRYPQGCIYMLNERNIAAVPNVFECFRIREGVPEYYEQLFISGFLNKQLARLINHGVRDDGLLNLTDKDFYSVSLPIPPISEQQKIAKILTDCDRTIELKQKLVDELKKLKKVCLTKMLPQEGETVPEIRFPGFSAHWEQRKLGEVSKRVIVGLATSVTPYYRDEGVPIFRNLNIQENYLDDSDILHLEQSYAQKQITKQVHTGDVLTVHTGYIGTSCVVPEKYDKCLTFTTLITTTNPVILIGEFLSQYLNSEKGMNAIQAVTTAGGRQNLNTNDFVRVNVLYPSLKEQNKICKLFRIIDKLTAVHQHNLEEERKKKKALMQLLLTGIIRVK